MNEIKCPVCGGRIQYHRINDDERFVSLPVDPEDIIADKDIRFGDSNGSAAWECVVDSQHELGEELIDYLDDEWLVTAEDCISRFEQWLKDNCTHAHVGTFEYILFLGCHEDNTGREPFPCEQDEVGTVPDELEPILAEAWEQGFDYLAIYY